jgi:general L-amino acid transport system ATP-binding protein
MSVEVVSAEALAPPLEIRGLCKWYGTFQALDGIDLTIVEGERLVICGPSGSGKSTLIRTVNALEGFQSGEILVGGITLTCSSLSTSSRT